MKDITVKYKKEELTVIWKSHLCIHSARCFTGLPTVFDPRVRPWITPEGAEKETIIEQIKKCPSAALSFTVESPANIVDSLNKNEMTDSVHPHITITANGPYLVKGTITLTDDQGNQIEKKENFALCRCGHSKNKPFCDGSHRASTDWLK